MLYQDESFRDIRPDISLLLVLLYLSHMINPVMFSKVSSGKALQRYIEFMTLQYVVSYQYPLMVSSGSLWNVMRGTLTVH